MNGCDLVESQVMSLYIKVRSFYYAISQHIQELLGTFLKLHVQEGHKVVTLCILRIFHASFLSSADFFQNQLF